MKGFRCNTCGLDGAGEPRAVPQDSADCFASEVAVCPDCGSDDIDIGEFTLDDATRTVADSADSAKGVTMDTISERQAVKENAIRLVKHHKEHCAGQDCDISLYLLRRALELAGIALTPEEKRLFM